MSDPLPSGPAALNCLVLAIPGQFRRADVVALRGVCLIVVGMFLTGCGTNSGAGGTSTPTAADDLSPSGASPSVDPSGDAPLAFAECMATSGWTPPLRRDAVVDLDGYTQANAECRTPVEGESVEASYCRFVSAIYDRSLYDPSMSPTGIPYMGTQESKRQAAVALYDEALQIAPAELIDDLHALQDGFRDGTPIPEAVGESVLDYHLSVCGAHVYLGSQD